MHRKLWTIIAISTLFLVITACGSPGLAPIQEYDRSIPTDVDGGEYSMSQIENAIVAGIQDRGWRARRTDREGHVEARLSQREHVVEVDIFFDQREYRIEYRDSENMSYHEDRELIHRNYNNWVNNLGRSINRSFDQL